MRFSLGLPLLQTIAMIIILWAPWSPGAHRIDIILRDGREIKGWKLVPEPETHAIAWAQGVNLPALPAEIPIDLAAERFQHLPELKLRFFSFWFFGLLTWYMIGRIGEDVVTWRQNAPPSPRLVDLLFAIETFLLALPSFLILTFDRSGAPPILTVWSTIWLAIASAALTVRLLQRVHYRNGVPA